MWKVARELAETEGTENVMQALDNPTYGGGKAAEILASRRELKEQVINTALKGWVNNTGDDKFSLDCLW